MFTYKPLRLLGKGSFGEVYYGIQQETGGAVAIKFLLREQATAIGRFQAEAQLLSSLAQEQFVVKILDMNLYATRPFIVVEFCDRGNLESVVGKIGWRDACQAVRHVAIALASVHRIGAFHRDIKPANIFLQSVPQTRQFVAKLGDFGVARNNQPLYGNLTFSLQGTLGYIAPEVERGEPFTMAADVYSLGITAIELVTGSRSPDALDHTSMPGEFREFLRAMSAPNPAARPTANSVAHSMEWLATLKEPSRNNGIAVAAGVGAAAVVFLLLLDVFSGRKK